MLKKILIAVSEFNHTITASLLEGAQKTLEEAGYSSRELKVVWVPGAFELPLVAAHGARSGHYGAVICLGCVIRGETPHFDYVCEQAASGMMQVGLETGVPVLFGVLTTDTPEQALARSGLAPHPTPGAGASSGIKPIISNKGHEAAVAALRMLAILDDLAPSQD